MPAIKITSNQAKEILTDCRFRKALTEIQLPAGRGYSKLQKDLLSILNAIAKEKTTFTPAEKKGHGGDLISSLDTNPMTALNQILNNTGAQQSFLQSLERQIELAKHSYDNPEPWDEDVSIEQEQQNSKKEINVLTALHSSFSKLPTKIANYARQNESGNPAKTKNATITRDMAKPLYDEVKRLGRMDELKYLNNNPYPNAFSKVLDILDIKPEKIDFNGDNGYKVKIDKASYDKINKIVNKARAANAPAKETRSSKGDEPTRTRPRR